MRAGLIVVLVLASVHLVLGAGQQIYVNMVPSRVESCYACEFGGLITKSTLTIDQFVCQWSVLQKPGTVLGQIFMPASSNDRMSYSEPICCKYKFQSAELNVIQQAVVLSASISFHRYAKYGQDNMTYDVVDNAYGFAIEDSKGRALIHKEWILSDDDMSTAPRVGTDQQYTYFGGSFDTSSSDQYYGSLSNAAYLVIAFQVVNIGQEAEVTYTGTGVTMLVQWPEGGLAFIYGLAFGLGVPVIFVIVFVPIYLRVIKPKMMEKKRLAKAMEEAKTNGSDVQPEVTSCGLASASS